MGFINIFEAINAYKTGVSKVPDFRGIFQIQGGKWPPEAKNSPFCPPFLVFSPFLTVKSSLNPVKSAKLPKMAEKIGDFPEKMTKSRGP